MKFIGDFHIHSHHSLATSKELCPDFIDYWAGLKGIKVVGTGDFTHPGWLKELKDMLEPAEEGLYKLKKESKKKVSPPVEEDARFMLTAEISNIYKKKGKVRKVHNIVFAPSFSVAEKIQNKLMNFGFNITSDGRPIIGMDSRDLLGLCLDSSEEIYFVPAHIWTPWFSLLGSKSGFDSVNECFEDLSPYITAVEMGLSTDPPMNWMCSFLDKYTLIANSDAHSPEKLGRNASIFDTDLSYYGIINSMKSGDKDSFLGSVDFFPQEGKYHFDGHRKCGIRWNPLETLRHDEICPVCGKEITIGVMNRIAQLADRDNILERENRHPYYSLIPLKEILSELEEAPPDSGKVDNRYKQLVHKAGSEFNLLLHYDIEYIRTIGGELFSEAVRRMRNREVYVQEGFDGEYGTIKVFKAGEIRHFIPSASLSLFNEPVSSYFTPGNPLPPVSLDIKAFRELKQQKQGLKSEDDKSLSREFPARGHMADLDDAQVKAVKHYRGPALVMAGPGTGKTRVLTTRIAWLIQKLNINPHTILAITFTNKAAREMKERLFHMLAREIPGQIRVFTFHAFGLSIIKEHLQNSGITNPFSVIDEDDKKQILSDLGVDKSIISETSEKISELKQLPDGLAAEADTSFTGILNKYNQALRRLNAFDFDDLIGVPVQLFREHTDLLSEYRKRIQWIMVDEYQDINLLQYRMIRMLMPDHDSNLFVIGDPNQAIYGFRGADVRYIQMFRDDYRNASVFRLMKSYRCTDSILKASGCVLKKDEKLLEGLQKGVKIKISENETDKSEAEFVSRTIENMIGGVGFFSIDSHVAEGNKDEKIESLSDFAILCRISRQMPVIEKALNDHNIPFQKVTEISLLKQEPVKSVLDVYRFSLNPGNTLLKSRLLKQKIITESSLTQMIETIKGKDPACKIERIINSYFQNYSDENNFVFSFLLDIAKEYEANEEEFLEHIMTGSGIDTWKPKVEAVSLMTLHASKGLEFNCVFITGCEEYLMPYSLFENKHADPEEERRLLYVGMTRARDYLFLTNARRRFLMGKEYTPKRSYFLDQIEEELVETEVQHIKTKEKKDREQLELF